MCGRRTEGFVSKKERGEGAKEEEEEGEKYVVKPPKRKWENISAVESDF